MNIWKYGLKHSWIRKIEFHSKLDNDVLALLLQASKEKIESSVKRNFETFQLEKMSFSPPFPPWKFKLANFESLPNPILSEEALKKLERVAKNYLTTMNQVLQFSDTPNSPIDSCSVRTDRI